MKRNLPNIVKYLIGASLALIAVSNCFNVLSNSGLFVASPAVDRAETGKLEAQKLGSLPSNAGSSLITGSPSKPTSPLATRILKASPLPPATTLTATKTDNLAQTAKVNPGDTIMYTVEITNTGAANATNVMFTDTVDTNTTLDMSSIKVSPIAVNDTYNTIGNVNIDVPA